MGKRLEEAGIGDDELRRIEGPHKIFPLRQIYARLATDRAVDLGDESRKERALRSDAAKIGRCDETSNVADHASSNRDQNRMPVSARTREPLEPTFFNRRQTFRRFAVVKEDRTPCAFAGEFGSEALTPIAPHARRRQGQTSRLISPDRSMSARARASTRSAQWTV